ncbi:MAG: AAA family ATPase [Eubacteriales bacterium]|nr:AAA family ATPase [Eubacteriales bacterium]
MQRVMIIGSNDAGKSTFSFQLAERTGLPLSHIDQMYYCGHWQIRPNAEFERMMREAVQKPRWIIEGNNLASLGQRLCCADTVLWFDFPPALCMLNLFRRELKYLHRVRPDMPDDCTNRLSFSFLRSAWQFNRRNRLRIRETLRPFPSVIVIRLTNYRQVRRFLASVSAEEN